MLVRIRSNERFLSVADTDCLGTSLYIYVANNGTSSNLDHVGIDDLFECHLVVIHIMAAILHRCSCNYLSNGWLAINAAYSLMHRSQYIIIIDVVDAPHKILLIDFIALERKAVRVAGIRQVLLQGLVAGQRAV